MSVDSGKVHSEREGQTGQSSPAELTRDPIRKKATSGNRGDDKAGGDEIGAGTFADKPSEPDDLTRGAPPKPKKRYSLAD